MSRTDKTPAFPFYGKDAYDDERFSALSWAAQGLFMFLAWWQWQEGSIPANLDRILDKISRRKIAETRRVWTDVEPFFPAITQSRRQNENIEERRSKMLNKRNRHREGADITNAKRWPLLSLSESLTDTHSESPRAASASASEMQAFLGSPEGVQGEIDSDAEFDALWADYPRPIGKQRALKAFRDTVRTPEDLAAIRTALANYKASGEVQRGFVMHGKTWFPQWRDWLKKERVFYTNGMTKEEWVSFFAGAEPPRPYGMPADEYDELYRTYWEQQNAKRNSTTEDAEEAVPTV